MAKDADSQPEALRVDGGMIANNWLLQALADITGIPAERPAVIETTALGAARLAGLRLGLFPDLEAIEATWSREKRADPSMDETRREAVIAGWQTAIERTQRT